MMTPRQVGSLLKQTFSAWQDDYTASMGAALAVLHACSRSRRY